ncbi:MAG: aspartate:alanine exchanger family transporter [Chloroherpetonaceae bacterium]
MTVLDLLRDFLSQNTIALLFLTIGFGYLLSKVEFKGVGLGVASVLFVGLAVGAFGEGRFKVPDVVGQLGLLLFVYTVGLQSGPGFFRILRQRGVSLTLLAVVSICAVAAVASLCATLFSVNGAIVVGMFCGSLTNTPALAAATEAIGNHPDASLIAVGYSVVYPLAVVLPILFSLAIASIRRIDIARETARAEETAGTKTEAPVGKNFVLQHAELVGKTVREALLIPFGVRVSRIKRGSDVFVGVANTVLQHGDVLRVVGSELAVQRAGDAIGPETTESPEAERKQVDFRRILLTNSSLVGKRLKELDLENTWGAVITRIRRGDIDFFPTDETVLERGDRLRVVAPTDRIADLTKYLGDSAKALSETDYLSLSLGILLAIGVGQIPIQVGEFELKLGLAGGALLVSLVLGYLGRTGSLIWDLPLEIDATFRQLGLVLFFASVGIKSGAQFADAVSGQGFLLISIGALLTFTSAFLLLVGAMGILRLDWVTATGTLAGGQTQPAVLSFIGKLAKSEAPTIAYSAVFPTAMILKILLAQALLWWLHLT